MITLENWFAAIGLLSVVYWFIRLIIWVEFHIFRKKQHLTYGLSEYDLNLLGEYNREVGHGVQHIAEYKKKMQELQEIYNSEISKCMKKGIK